MNSTQDGRVLVKRDGGKGYRWIDQAKYDASPKDYELMDIKKLPKPVAPVERPSQEVIQARVGELLDGEAAKEAAKKAAGASEAELTAKYEAMTKDEIKELLDAKKVTYDSKATKPDLIAALIESGKAK